MLFYVKENVGVSKKMGFCEEESRIAERDVARKKMTREEKMKVKGLKKNRLKKR